MDTSADLGVSLDELVLEVNENDSVIDATTTMGLFRDKVDVDVIDFEAGNENPVLDTLEVDASADHGVSLDDLKLEISGDGTLKKIATIEEPGNDVDVVKAFNRKEIDENVHKTPPLPKELTKCSPHQNMMLTKPTHVEDNINSLSVFTNSKINTSTKEDSDSEFEVPDRPSAPSADDARKCLSTNIHAELISNREQSGMQDAESDQVININLTSQKQSSLYQESVYSHDKIYTDSDMVSKSSVALPKSMAQSASVHNQNNLVTFCKANNQGDSFDSTIEEKENNYHKSSSEVSPESHLSGQYFMQHQLSDVTTQHVISPVIPKTDDDTINSASFSRPNIVTTADEWENIQIIEPGFLPAHDRQPGPGLAIESKPLASFLDTWLFFKSADYTSVKSKIKIQVERQGLSALAHMIFGPPKLHRDLLPQKELIFCVAATQFDNSIETHNRVLQTIYRCLTGSRFDCQRFGSHWEQIGFQGKDPATDLRGTGMLGLLHLLYFLQNTNTRDLARDVYKLSLHPTQNFPFCLMGINLSRICLQVLREDIYNKECNKRKDVMSTVNYLYSALFLHFFRAWKKGKTIMDSGFVLQEIETYCRKHTKGIFKVFETYERDKTQHDQSINDLNSEPIFFNVCKEDKG